VPQLSSKWIGQDDGLRDPYGCPSARHVAQLFSKHSVPGPQPIWPGGNTCSYYWVLAEGLSDVQLWRDGKLLDHGLELKALLTANSATISITITKSGTWGQELVWETLLGANLTRREYVGYSKCTVLSLTVKTLQGYNVVGLFFGADWCKPCLELIPVLDRLYLAQAARGAHRLEIVLVLHCQEAKATKYYGLGMPWLAMYHNADGKVGMNTRTTALMAKFGVTNIPALVLLDKRGQVICTEGRGWCVADPVNYF
jgi:thiol-disulfide isomerase/thioredoxin